MQRTFLIPVHVPWSCISCEDEHIFCQCWFIISRHTVKNAYTVVSVVAMFYFYRLTGYTAMRHAMSTWVASLLMNFTSLCKTLHSQEKHCRYTKYWALFLCMWPYLLFLWHVYLATAWPTHPLRACEKGRQILTPENEAHICTIRVWITIVLCLILITRVWM